MLDRRQFIAAGAATIATSTSGVWAKAAKDARTVAGNVAAYLAPLVARNDYSGFILLERDGKTLLSRGFGYADDRRRTPHTADTRYATASTGKMFTRAAVLQLEKADKLSHTDPLSRFLPAFPSGSSITVQHLVDHKSGIARDLPPGIDLRSPRTLDELVTIIARQPIEAKAGEQEAYSNNGYRLLAKIIEVAGGGDFDRLISELVLEPRAMRNTVPNLGKRVPREAKGFQPGPGWNQKVPAAAFDMTNWRGAGSFLVTPADMMRFVRTLPLEASDLASAPTTDAAGKPRPRGVGHDGFGDGFANLAFAYPDERAYLVSLSNMQSGAFTPMHADMRRLLFGEIVPTPVLPDAVSDAIVGDWDRFIGDYDLRPGAPLIIRRVRDYLTADAGEGGHPLIPLGGDRFFMRLRYATMTFEGAPGQPASLLRWAEGGGEFPLKRIS